MKAYIDQIFYEGLGRSVYCPIENKINKLKNDSIKKLLITIVKILYFIVAITLASMLVYYKI